MSEAARRRALAFAAQQGQAKQMLAGLLKEPTPISAQERTESSLLAPGFSQA